MALSEIEEEENREKGVFKELSALAVEISRFLEGKSEFFKGVENLRKDLSGGARRRLYGAGPNNFGLINMVYDIARDNPDSTPKVFSVEDFHENLEDFKKMQQLVLVLRQFLESAESVALLESNRLYLDSLRVYRNLREQTRGRVRGAEELFNSLRKYFRRSKRNDDKPTYKELERDFRKLLHGEASGEVTVVNESPALKAGKRKVVDRVIKGKRAVKVAGEGEEET
jgi:hypothetical protein